MASEATAKKRYFRRRGALAQSSRSVRIAAIVVLAVTCAAFTFMQLGFAGIGIPGQYVAYAVVLLIPIALASLLLGTLTGTLMGLFAGSVLYMHSIIMPLDSFELTFINPITSIVMLGASGLSLGLLFSFALRNSPSPLRTIVYIVLICIIVSWLYSFGFSVITSFLTQTTIAASLSGSIPVVGLSAVSQQGPVTVAMRLGNVFVQAWTDAILMALFCIAGEFAARRALRAAKHIGLRATFALWLSVVAFVAFLAISGVSFVAITNSEIARVALDMESEINYIDGQLDNADERINLLFDTIEDTGIELADITSEMSSKIAQSFSSSTIFDGYTAEEDGTYFALFGESLATDEKGEADRTASTGSSFILLSDDERFEPGVPLSNVVSTEIIDAIDKSLQTGRIQRAVLDVTSDASLEVSTGLENPPIQSEIAYVFAKNDGDHTIVGMRTADKVFVNRSAIMRWTSLTVLILLAIVFIMAFFLIDRVVIGRINETNRALSRITEGDLDVLVDVQTPREFASLSDGVNDTVRALKNSIAEAETRMDAELATAKEIQASALPRVFPPFPDIADFDIYATMKAAKEVGGDFYDFFLIEDADAASSKLAFIMADVSGKGVPAALFMMKAKTQLRDYLDTGIEIGEAVENANRQLCQGNDTRMFVTVFAAVLDYHTGEMEYVNAGHNPPLLRHKGEWTWVRDKSGLFLGAYPTLSYKSYRMTLEPNDELLLYTDGVTEAWNPAQECYGENRLEELLKTCPKIHPRGLVDTVRHDVALHAQGAEQSDDITILALEMGVPPEVTETISVPADVKELPRIRDFIHAELDQRLCPLRVQNQLDIAVEEMFVNVAYYAYPDATPDNPGIARISCTYSAEPPSVIVEISDDGVPYNPLEKPDTETPDDIMDVPIGGLGILIAKQSVDEISYERVNDSNVVTLVKKW